MTKEGSFVTKVLSRYVSLVFALSVPLWLLASLTEGLDLPVNLPISSAMAFCPMLVAFILTGKEKGTKGIKALALRILDFSRIKDKRWLLPVILIMPGIMVLSYIIMQIAGMPLPQKSEFPRFSLLLYFAVFFVAAAGEETGWTGYLTEPLQNRLGMFKAGILMGMIWAVWHTIPFIQTGNAAEWIVWQGIVVVGMRVLIVWIFNKTGKSVFVAIVFHAMGNMGMLLFPNYGSNYNPMISGIIIIALVVIIGYCEFSKPSMQAGKS